MKILKFSAICCPICPIMKLKWTEIEEALPWLKNEKKLRLHGEHSVQVLSKMVDKNKDR